MHATRLFDSNKVNKHWRNNLIFFICLITLGIIGPSINFVAEHPVLSNVFYTLLVASSVFVLDFYPVIRRTLSIFGVVVILGVWFDFIFNIDRIESIVFLLFIIYLFLISISLIIHVAISKDVNANIIFSAINGYLLIGIIGGITLFIVSLSSDGPILTNSQGTVAEYLYFSFVTVTTLGYGDLTPLTPATRSVAMLLAVFGQLYIAILIAILVGKYLNKKD